MAGPFGLWVRKVIPSREAGFCKLETEAVLMPGPAGYPQLPFLRPAPPQTAQPAPAPADKIPIPSFPVEQ